MYLLELTDGPCKGVYQHVECQPSFYVKLPNAKWVSYYRLPGNDKPVPISQAKTLSGKKKSLAYCHRVMYKYCWQFGERDESHEYIQLYLRRFKERHGCSPELIGG